MEDAADLLQHRIPDVLSTAGLPVRLAAEIDFLAGRVHRWCDRSDHSTAAISARSLAVLGRTSEACRALGDVDIDRAPIVDLAAAAWAASRVGGPTVSSILARLRNQSSEFLDEELPVGPRRLYTGMLLGAQGDLRAAIDELTSAVTVGDARAPVWGALCRLELGRVLRTAEAVPIGDVARSAPVLTAARTFFGAGGYRWLSARIDEVDGPVRALLDVGRPAEVGFGVQPEHEIRTSKGLVALAHLIANDERVVSAAEVACVVDGGAASDIASMTSTAWNAGSTDLDRHLDQQLDRPLDNGADGTTEMLRAVLFDETTRSRVTKLLRRTISNLNDVHPVIGAHLAASVVTGYGCRYRPTGAPVAWHIPRRP
jgi:hypothetical protein